MMFKQIPVTVCHNSGTVRIKKQSDGCSINGETSKVQKISIVSHYLIKHSSIFFKFSQELYYMMLKQIPVTVCHNFWSIHYSKVSKK